MTLQNFWIAEINKIGGFNKIINLLESLKRKVLKKETYHIDTTIFYLNRIHYCNNISIETDFINNREDIINRYIFYNGMAKKYNSKELNCISESYLFCLNHCKRLRNIA